MQLHFPMQLNSTNPTYDVDDDHDDETCVVDAADAVVVVAAAAVDVVHDQNVDHLIVDVDAAAAAALHDVAAAADVDGVVDERFASHNMNQASYPLN